MTNKRFISTFALMFLLFFVIFGSAGCGGGSNNSKFVDNEPNKDNSFTVTFDSNGGSYVPSQTVNSGERAAKPTDPTREGYTFLGWYLNTGLSFDFNTPITSNITLLAMWRENEPVIPTYTITFDSNGGSYVPSQTVNSGERAAKPTDPTREGYTFLGWYSDSSLTELFDFDSAIINDITLYSKWIASSTPTPTPSSYTVDFDSNGGTEVASQIISPDEVIIKPDEPYKEGFTFMGWYDFDGHMFSFGTSIDHDVILTAEWEQTVSATYEEIAELQKKHEYEGIDTISLDKSGPLTSVEIQYKTDGFALISVSELSEDPILNAPGLIGCPIEISHIGGSVKEAMITFYYDPSALSIDANNLGIVYYDEAWRELRLLGEDSTVDTLNNAVYVVTRHFSRYGVVDREQWQKAWDEVLPKSKRKNTGRDKDTQNVIIVFDCSSHITREAMYIAQKSAQNLIDTLSVGDNVIVVSLANSFQYTAYGTIADTTSIKNGVSYVSKSDIKSAISSVMPIWNAQSKLKNLNNLIVMYVSPPAGSTVCLLSDGDFGDGYIIEGNLQKYKNEGTKFITVCAGDTKDDTLMKHIAKATGGVYIHAETEQTFEDKFSETDIYARLKELSDSDGDSFFDIAETQGMRDQYGEHIKTEPGKADTDGDGISDDIEMGEYHESTGLGNRDHFKRDSDPRIYTVTSILANVDLSANNGWVDMKRVIDTKNKQIILAASITERRQVLIGNDKECIYVPSENLKVEVSSPNGNYTIIDDLLVEATEINDGRTYSAYHVFVTLSYKNYPSKYDTITWRITADNLARPGTTDERIGYIEDEGPVLGLNDPINDHNLATRLKAWRAVLEKEFIEKLCANAQQASQNANNDAELKKRKDALLKHMKQYGGSTVPDEVCEAFALAVLDTYDSDGSKVEKYSKNVEELTKQLLNQIGSSVKSGEKEVVAGGHLYRVKFTFMRMEGTEVDFAYVDRDGRSYATLVWTTSMDEMKEALASYCAKLAELHKDVWNDFLVSYAYDALQEIGVDVTKDTVEKIFGFTENTIKGLCGDKRAANEVVDELVGAAKDKLKSRLFGDNKFLKFVEENFPKGPTLVRTAEKLNMLREKYDDFNDAMARYNIASIFGAGDGSDLLNTFEAFKTVYNEINEENLLNEFWPYPLTSWPASW